MPHAAAPTRRPPGLPPAFPVALLVAFLVAFLVAPAGAPGPAAPGPATQAAATQAADTTPGTRHVRSETGPEGHPGRPVLAGARTAVAAAPDHAGPVAVPPGRADAAVPGTSPGPGTTTSAGDPSAGTRAGGHERAPPAGTV